MEWLLEWGYLGVFLGSFLGATLVPFSSDALLIGMLAAGGKIALTVVCASLGNWLGGLLGFWLGYAGKWEWLEKWFKVKRETLEKQKTRVDKYGAWLAFFSWLPVVGDLFPIALGFYRVRPGRSILFMLIGKSARFVGWAVLFVWVKPLFA